MQNNNCNDIFGNIFDAYNMLGIIKILQKWKLR